MDDRQKTDTAPRDQTPIRRPWHAPQFVIADFALTGTASNAGHDGGVFPAYSQS
jgi:hypothetical protein